MVMVARRTHSGSGGSAQLLHGAATMVVGRRRRSRGGAVRCRRRNDGLERRRCAGRWELCGTVALVVGKDEGWPKMVKLAEKSEKMSLHNEEIGVF
ncbi:hypothetical protein DEO72_LG9g69 [Vigna unguiculata]|uniref:Uncharacterized protein n=1 Tax=Vigna unguiculata TaxID=3917 RepID=A0A4D6MY55_VIGUN|nr:hypothetical protein DEO72_LG9g69 [Vigna unguiculata]